MEEPRTAPEASEQDAPNENNSSVAPTENKEAVEIKEDIDPRIVEMIGKDKIQSAFGEKPEADGKPTEEESKDALNGDPKKEGQDDKVNEDVESPRIAPPEARSTRLDRRLANRHIHMLHLFGEKNVPTEEEILADLKSYSKEDKVASLKEHLRKIKEFRGENITGDELEEDDKEAIKDADREEIRQEILAEENEKREKKSFISFIDEHTELIPDSPDSKKNYPNKKPFDPILAKAVEKLTFPYGIEGPAGMSIQEAFETVTEEIESVRKAKLAEEKKVKSAALSGVLSGNGQVIPTDKELDWDDVKKIQQEDPVAYRRMLAEGKFKHLM